MVRSLCFVFRLMAVVSCLSEVAGATVCVVCLEGDTVYYHFMLYGE